MADANVLHMESTIYEYAGGEEPLRHFVEIFYHSVLVDPVLGPVFNGGSPEHIPHLAAFDAEAFGGPERYTNEFGGFQTIIDAHRNLRITEEQRQRFVELYLAAADAAGLPDDPRFRATLRSHVEFGSQVAVQNSNARTDAELHPLREVPKWNWEEPDGS
jgi:hemoglobin